MKAVPSRAAQVQTKENEERLEHRSRVIVLPILEQPETFTNTNLKPKHCLGVVFRPKTFS